MVTIQKICLIFSIVGAIVWGIYGIFDVNIVNKIFSSMAFVEKAIYIIVGICGLVNIGLLFMNIDE